MAKRGRPAIKKVPFSKTRLKEALKYKHVSLRDLNNDPIVQASEKTIRRAAQEGTINPEILNRLSKRLDANPSFLSGIYDMRAELLSNGNKEEADDIKSKIKIENHPYLEKEQNEVDIWDVYLKLAIYNNVPESQFNSLNREQLVRFYLDMDRATSGVINKYFTPQQYGYYESIPMPPEEGIVIASW